MIVGLALLVEVIQILLAVLLSLDPQQHARVRPAEFGVGIGLAFVLLALWPGLQLQVVRQAGVGILLLWFGMNTLHVIITHRAITSGLLLHLVLVALFAFTWTPARWATGLITAAYALLIGANTVSQTQDPVGVILIGPVLLLIWYLAQHGWTIRTERRRLEELTDIAYLDPLTGLLNRRSGWMRLAELADAWQSDPQRLAVVMLDLDHFKAINDAGGHDHGDAILKAIAATLMATVRHQDVVIRWGGEEFLVILVSTGHEPGDAQHITERLLEAVRTLQLPGTVKVTMSAGIATLKESRSLKGVIALADLRLYEAKASGRDRTVSVGPQRPEHVVLAPPS
ncbi:hypothetical protein GCM10008957_34790 [Deinococcus ruber]|uniref:GGDEF domain-containing protein n=2 Tax=Deinococcus ruber TaxID=1848197 RepID=A0A918FBM8_9DEIO|nr:hypothetical protein GCM10008957_34790 [Deinococcus ruber]